MSYLVNNNTDVTLHTNDNSGNNNGSSAAMIISFEVIFSVAIFAVVAMCYFLGIKKRNKLRKAKIEHYENMVERALTRHEQLLTRRLHESNSSATVTSTSTFTNSNINNDPPPYFPRANDPNCPQLLEKDVSRLSQALLAMHLARSSPSTSAYLPPKYSETYQNNHQSSLNNNNNNGTLFKPPPPLITRTSSIPSINHTIDSLKHTQR
ncbi:hypothetical protein BJ944DRAFT_84287 [Cunninghamella echinulata]|nr:hypothetical protein BJ944DRAFT_84287 [Cunninghamella echinulata]